MDQEATPVPRKRTRTSRQKVKTGCLTCKIRHVKCDEQRPSCLRCTYLGKTCGGYQHLERPPASTSSRSDTPLGSPSPSSPDRSLEAFVIHSPRERRAIEFFYHKAVPQLSGYFQGEFWKHCIFQLSQDEPATRHAIFALSRMYEEDLFGAVASPVGESSENFAVESYNRAIRSLITQLNNPEQVRVGLTVCIIFICIACLRRDIPTALKHIDGGIKLLTVWREKHADLTAEFEIVEEILIPMLAWLNMVASLFGRPSFGMQALSAIDRSDPLTKPGCTLTDAIYSLVGVIDKCIKFMISVLELKYSLSVPEETLAEQHRLDKLFDEWQINFGNVVKDKNTSNGVNLILGSSLAIQIWLRSCLSPYESNWDQFRPQFEEILNRFERVVDDAYRFPDKQSKEFSFELGILPALQFVVGKCRYGSLRRKALKLIAAAPKRECIFDSTYSYALYERVMHLEEASLGLQAGQVPTDDQLPVETARICHVDMPPLPARPNGRPVNFLSKPNGFQGSWHVHSEYLNLNSSELIRWFDLRGASSEPQSSVATAFNLNASVAI